MKIISYFFTGIITLIVSVFLGGVAIAFCLGALLVTLISFSNLLGVTRIPFNVGLINLKSGIVQVFVALVVAVGFIFVARFSWSGLKGYLSLISNANK